MRELEMCAVFSNQKISRYGWLAVLIGIFPILLYWLLVGRYPWVTPRQALNLLNTQGSTAVLVDVRAQVSYQENHIEGALNWPLAEIREGGFPEILAGKTLFLICDTGLQSAQVVKTLLAQGVQNVYSVRGGLQEWVKAASENPELQYTLFVDSDRNVYFPVENISQAEQVAQAGAGLMIKPLYSILALGLIVALWREKAADLTALRWGIVAFFVGEAFCALNYWVLRHESYLSEYLHMYGMVVGFGLAFYAVFDGLDKRVLHLTDPVKKCAFKDVCGRCAKATPGLCKGRQLLKVIFPLVGLLALIPLFAPLSLRANTTTVFGFPYYFARLAVYQWYENDFLPILALVLLAVAYLPLWMNKQEAIPRTTRLLFSFAVGALGFSFFRLGFGAMFDSNQVWFTFWEETTELMFIVAVIGFLWLFRGHLLENKTWFEQFIS